MKQCYNKVSVSFSTVLSVSLITLMFFMLGTTPINAQGSGNALDFDGTNDYVNISYDTGLPIYDDGSGAYTVEFWVKGASGQTQQHIFTESNSGSTFPGDAYPLFMISTGGTGLTDKLDIYIRSGPSSPEIKINHQVSSTTVFDNSWHHVAWIDDNTTCELYVDGVLDGTSFTYDHPRSTTVLNVTSLAVLNRPGLDGTTDFFQGQLDEIRLWNTARTITEIQDNMCRKLTGSETGLVAYWKVDQSSGTNLPDFANNNYGTLNNMDDTDWVTSGAAIGDASIADYSSPSSVNLSHPNGDNVTVNIITGSPVGVQIYRVDEAPNVTTAAGLNHLDPLRYWGVFVVGGGTYNFVYDYDGHPGITNENTLDLASRADNSAASWSYANLTPNTSAHTLMLTGESGRGEYILGSENTDNPLPVQLSLFKATTVGNGMQLNWTTQSEVNNLGFEIWRSANNPDNYQLLASYETNDQLKGAGNSNTAHHYSFLDEDIQMEQTYYYKLYDVSYSGERNQLQTLGVEATEPVAERFELFQNYPNPFNAGTVISFQLPAGNENSAAVNLSIFDPLGRKICTLLNSQLPTGQEYDVNWNGTDDSGNLVPSGIYFYTLHVGSRAVSRKLMMVR